MKKLLVTGLCLFSLAAFADNHEEGSGKNFEEQKAQIIQNLDKRIAGLNEMKSCISAAADKAAAKACREKFKEAKEDMKEEWKEKKRSLQEMRKKK